MAAIFTLPPCAIILHQNDDWGRRWVYLVPVAAEKGQKASRTPKVSRVTIDQPPSGIELDQACGELLRITGIPSEWIDQLSEQDLEVKHAHDCVVRISPASSLYDGRCG